jgi:hypothetical protein
MYWIFLVVFITAVLAPDIIRHDMFFLSETRAEEILIFLSGVISIVAFLKKDQLLIFHKKEKEKDQKTIKRAVGDLMESYSYIGEVNRKIDLLISISLGIADRSLLDKYKEKEIYQSIAAASNFLLKAETCIIRVINLKDKKTEKEFKVNPNGRNIKNDELAAMEKNIGVKKNNNWLIVSSKQTVNGMRSFIAVWGHGEEEENNPKNLEIVKMFASQVLFMYLFAKNNNNEKSVG